MKHVVTIALAFIFSGVCAQNSVMPYNPDADGDALIGSQDLISFLGVYNTLMIDSSLTCDYEGTEFESWVGGLFEGTLILDSVYVEYLLIDTVSTFLPGCPDPVDIETVLERSYTTHTGFFNQSESDFWVGGFNYLGFFRSIRLRFTDDGRYVLLLQDEEVEELTSFSEYSYWNGLAPECCGTDAILPFPENWSLDEDGIQVDWRQYDWTHNCEHFRLIPFWHEAE
jgi:hypothetical protein